MNFNMNKQGYFITFEGIDGCGKTTQMKRLGEILESQGKTVIYTREPGGTPISETIRNVILDCKNTAMTGMTEMLLYAASRAQHVEECIMPAVKAGHIVLCDRFYDSTLAYQGGGRSIPKEQLQRVNELAIQSMWPNLTIYFDIDYETSQERLSTRGAKDRLDLEKRTFVEAVIQRYRDMVKRYPERILSVDARGEIEPTFETMLASIKAKGLIL